MFILQIFLQLNMAKISCPTAYKNSEVCFFYILLLFASLRETDAVCQKHSANAQIHSTKPLASATLNKEHTKKFWPAKGSLPSVFYGGEKIKKAKKKEKICFFLKGCHQLAHPPPPFFQLFSTKSANTPQASSLLHNCTTPSHVITLRFGSSYIILSHM